jgi:hypothetical protein
MNFPDIIMERINSCLKARVISISQYLLEVENLCDAMVSYWDKDFITEMKSFKIQPDLNNPYFEDIKPEAKEESARGVFRCVMKLVQRSGFISEKTIEGLLDEATIDTIISSITKGSEIK